MAFMRHLPHRPSTGEKKTNRNLRLGVFTQDLAQELDADSRAVDLVTAHAREGAGGDISISDLQARNAMGALGLSGDKPLRLVQDLSGGEKARVALSMFALRPSNMLLLDEPSNHLDVGCVDALAEALGGWGGDDAAVVVVSHDRSFCERVGFTHVGTVSDGRVVLEERDLRPADWTRYGMDSLGSASAASSPAAEAPLTPEEKEAQKQLRRRLHNAPKRIAKLEQLISKAEEKIGEVDAAMFEAGADVGKLTDLQTEKEVLEGTVEKHMEEWEELEELMLQLA
mmetsp:Transcript_14522/g.31958  ORF Transcript_14522/g.31958 Transcript_14522/m.31958 type:complete len:284 (-) Transcript_14522:967-1818(-)